MKAVLGRQWESNTKFPESWVEIPRKMEGTFPDITRKTVERHVEFLKRCRKMQESNGKFPVELYILWFLKPWGTILEIMLRKAQKINYCEKWGESKTRR